MTGMSSIQKQLAIDPLASIQTIIPMNNLCPFVACEGNAH